VIARFLLDVPATRAAVMRGQASQDPRGRLEACQSAQADGAGGQDEGDGRDFPRHKAHGPSLFGKGFATSDLCGLGRVASRANEDAHNT
jgi:hypothetical protein